MKNRLLVISGPSGAGKTTLIEKLLARRNDLALLKSYTTRKPRRDENEYHYTDTAPFEKMIREDAFAEYSRYSGNYYGTPLRELNEIFAAGKMPVLNIDVKGFRKLKRRLAESTEITSVFLLPSSAAVLYQRLRRRGETGSELITRLQSALFELGNTDAYDHVVLSEDGAAEDVLAVIDGKRCREERIDPETFVRDLAMIIDVLQEREQEQLKCRPHTVSVVIDAGAARIGLSDFLRRVNILILELNRILLSGSGNRIIDFAVVSGNGTYTDHGRGGKQLRYMDFDDVPSADVTPDSLRAYLDKEAQRLLQCVDPGTGADLVMFSCLKQENPVSESSGIRLHLFSASAETPCYDMLAIIFWKMKVCIRELMEE